MDIKIENNEIVDGDREGAIIPLKNELLGLSFYPHDTRTIGLGYFEIGDRITLVDSSENEFEVLIFDIEIDVTTGFIERLKCGIPDVSATDYDMAGKIGQRFTRAEIKVNKNEGEILSVANRITSVAGNTETAISMAEANASDISDVEDAVTVLEQTATALQLSVLGQGGTNLLKNSVGLKGDIEEWQIYLDDELVDTDNDGTITQTTDVSNNTESNSAILIEEQYILQTFKTIIGETYTFYCRYYSDTEVILSITGIDNVTLADTEDVWTVHKSEFVATQNDTTLRIDNTAEVGSGAVFSDLIVKIGDVNGWTQAPNEIYGSNFRFDKDGFEVSSQDSAFRSLLDWEKLSVINDDTDVIVMQVSKDSGELYNLVVKDFLQVQREGNSAKAVKFIPTATGCMVVVND